MNGGVCRAKELRKKRWPSSSRSHKVHDLGDHSCRCVKLAAEIGQFTLDPLMLGILTVQKGYSWPRVEQQRPHVRQFRSRSSRCQASCHSAGPSLPATCAARAPTERSETASSRVSRTNSDNDFPRSAARALIASRNSELARTVIVVRTYDHRTTYSVSEGCRAVTGPQLTE